MEIYELTQAYKSYANYTFPKHETRHPRCKSAADSVLFTLTNDDCQFSYCKCVLQKCTTCTSTSLQRIEIDTSKRAPMIMFNTNMTVFTCSHHVILIRGKITTCLDAK